MSSKVNGFVANGFEKIQKTFQEIISEAPDSGAAVSIWHEGENVVNLWGGIANRDTKAAWVEDTKVVVFSSTKGLMSLALALLFQAGKFSYEDLVSKYWPEYQNAGKEKTTIGQLVSHQAGVPYFAEDIDQEQVINWDYMVSKIEQEAPLWQPGSAYAYHAITHGWLTGELVRRVSGMSPGEYLAREISAPLYADTWLGLPLELEFEVAPSYVHPELTSFFADLEKKNTGPGNFLIRSLTLGGAFSINLVGKNKDFNSLAVHAAEIPGAGGISTAYGISKIWSSVVHQTDGVRLLSDESIAHVTKVQSEGKPFTDLEPPYSKFGMGFQLDSAARRYLTNSSFGHDGAGGQCAFADPEHKIGFAFVTTEMRGGEVQDDRATKMIEDLREALKAKNNSLN
jgi:CubicO group peptidase (beta-lactamase class C family)